MLQNLTPARKRHRLIKHALMFARRAHLYLGLFLLPWVLLYGITGPMFSHQQLISEGQFQTLAIDDLEVPINKFPKLHKLAEEVVEQIRVSAGSQKIEINQPHSPSLTSAISFEVDGDNSRIMVDIDPIYQVATVARYPLNTETPKKLLPGIKEVALPEPPLKLAEASVEAILKKAGIIDGKNTRSFGWTKLNFLANVDGTPARITYVFNDHHINVSEYKGEDGMTGREFFMRLHTTHGFPISWNARRFWIVLSDLMGIAMVSWAITGLLMWWQIKRTRLFGAFVIASSLVVAGVLYWSVHYFYATNVL